jgi:hypothetical protein
VRAQIWACLIKTLDETDTGPALADIGLENKGPTPAPIANSGFERGEPLVQRIWLDEHSRNNRVLRKESENAPLGFADQAAQRDTGIRQGASGKAAVPQGKQQEVRN